MKCPKCAYLGFETGDRCKNCGYDFALLSAVESDPSDFIHRADELDRVDHGASKEPDYVFRTGGSILTIDGLTFVTNRLAGGRGPHLWVSRRPLRLSSI